MSDPYAGRKVDILVLRGQKPVGEAPLAQDWLGDGGQVCAGVVKVAQWAVVELLTIRGTRQFDQPGGTEFFSKLMSGRMRTETDVFVAFGFGVGDIQARARQVEPVDAPADERFADWVLNRVAIATGEVLLYTTLSTAAGDDREVILPIPIAQR